MRSILFNVGTFSCSSSFLSSVYIIYVIRIVSKCLKAGAYNWMIFYFIAFISSIHSKRLRTQTRDDVVNADFVRNDFPARFFARVKPCHLPACTKQHLIHSLVLSIDHNNKHLRSGAPTLDFFISTGWPTSAMWFFQEGLWCHRAFIDSLPSIIFFVCEDLAQNVNLFMHFVVFRQLQFFVSCLSSYNYSIMRGSKRRKIWSCEMEDRCETDFHFHFQIVVQISSEASVMKLFQLGFRCAVTRTRQGGIWNPWLVKMNALRCFETLGTSDPATQRHIP
jgi:hypothetical protein